MHASSSDGPISPREMTDDWPFFFPQRDEELNGLSVFLALLLFKICSLSDFSFIKKNLSI